MFKLGGYKPSPDDIEYVKFGTARTGLVKLAASSDQEYRIPEFTPISNQGSLSSCVANSTCDAFEVLMGVSGKKVVELSRLFVYWNARVYTHDTDKDDGTFIHNAFDSLTRLGVCPESEYPYLSSMVFAQPTLRAYKTANDNMISGFYRIDSYGDQRLRDIEAAVRANHPVVFGTAVDAVFQSSMGVDRTFTTPQASIGNHAMIVVGVRRNPDLQFYIRNSWGSGWGSNGHCWMDSNYLAARETSDLWVPTNVDELIV